jgi:hypothetical protein
MSTYGVRLSDTSGNTYTMSPDAMTIVSAGSVAMPAGLNVDNTYGVDIDLPASNIPVANIGVLVSPRVSAGSGSVVYTRYIDTTLYYTTFYASSAATFYTRNDSTGVMTAWSAGNRTANNKSTWDPILSTYPIAFWDKMGATTFSKIRLFAASAFLVRDTAGNDTNLSLAGTATGDGSGYESGGAPTDVNDNNEATSYWFGAYAGVEEYSPFSYNAVIDLGGAKRISKVEILHSVYGAVWDGSNWGIVNVSIYSQTTGTWIVIITRAWSGSVNQGYLEWEYGYWNNITKIRVESSGYAQGGDESSAYCRHYTYELRVYGNSYTDDQENKIVYTIGSAGITTVDYLVAIKKYNY